MAEYPAEAWMSCQPYKGSFWCRKVILEHQKRTSNENFCPDGSNRTGGRGICIASGYRVPIDLTMCSVAV